MQDWHGQSAAERLGADMPVSSTGSCTSETIARDDDTISKIRARHDMRKELLYTVHADGARESRVREQQVSGQKPYQTLRLGPVVLAVQ